MQGSARAHRPPRHPPRRRHPRGCCRVVAEAVTGRLMPLGRLRGRLTGRHTARPHISHWVAGGVCAGGHRSQVQVAVPGQHSPPHVERKGRRSLDQQSGVSSGDDAESLGPSVSMAHGPAASAPKQSRAGTGSVVSMSTAMSRPAGSTDSTPFSYQVDQRPHKLEVWMVNRQMWENIQSVFLI